MSTITLAVPDAQPIPPDVPAPRGPVLQNIMAGIVPTDVVKADEAQVEPPRLTLVVSFGLPDGTYGHSAMEFAVGIGPTQVAAGLMQFAQAIHQAGVQFAASQVQVLVPGQEVLTP